MANFVFDDCCFCVDLRVGSFIIGYLNLIFCAIATVIYIITVAGGAAVTASAGDDDMKYAGTIILVLGIFMLLLIAVQLAFGIVLLVGLHKNKPGHVKAYVVYCCVFLVLSLILFIVTLAKGPYDGGIIAGRVLGLLFSAYFVMVIRSYYYRMLDEAAEQPHCDR